MTKLPLAAALAALVTAAAAAPSAATVPPKNCGFMTLEGHRYNVKADQMRCRTARSDLERYVVERKRPGAGWRCRTYTGQALRYRCFKGVRELFGILRS
jgi:hypothetical protein